MAVPVKIEVPEGMYENIKKLVERKLFRNVADFFYVAGHKDSMKRGLKENRLLLVRLSKAFDSMKRGLKVLWTSSRVIIPNPSLDEKRIESNPVKRRSLNTTCLTR